MSEERKPETPLQVVDQILTRMDYSKRSDGNWEHARTGHTLSPEATDDLAGIIRDYNDADTTEQQPRRRLPGGNIYK